jgi:hypothetical protein
LSRLGEDNKETAVGRAGLYMFIELCNRNKSYLRKTGSE